MLTKEEIREALVERHSEEVQSKLDEAKLADLALILHFFLPESVWDICI